MNQKRVSVVIGLVISQCLVSSAMADAFSGQAVSVSGKVLVRNEKSQNQMSFLKAGDKIVEGSIINTGSTGSAKLLMTDKTIVDLGPSSLFKINEYQLNKGGDRKVDVALDYGQIRASVNQPVNDKGKFTIRTKAATMGVRGTEFVVAAAIPPRAGEAAPPQQTQVTVIKGRVDVSDIRTPNLPPVQVRSGMQLLKGVDSAPKLTQLDPKQIQAVKAEAFQKDMTFIQAVAIEPETPEQQQANREANQQAAEKKEATQTASNEGGPRDAPKEEGPRSGSKQTLQNIAATVEAQVKSGAPIAPQVADLKLPGTFGPAGTQSRPVDVLQGQPVNVRIQFTP